MEYDWQMAKLSNKYLLLVGDTVVVFVAAVIGFLSHSESPLALVNRFLASWIPFTFAWIVAGYGLDLYSTDRFSLSRLLLGAILAAPLGGLLRGLWLGTVIQTTFVFVMAAVLALGMIVWRWVWYRMRFQRET
jgi:hypothetical protein